VDLNARLHDMLLMFERLLGEQYSVDTHLDPDLCAVEIDPTQLEVAILNIVVNARDAMAGGGALSLATARWPVDVARDEQGYAAICITDSGIGMNADTLARAMEPFFTTKVVGKGTGLGLSQVFGFAKQSGGHVAIYSEPGQGTTVKLYLPRSRVAIAEPAGEVATAMLPNGSSDEIILVVEDEQRVRHFSVDALRELGYTAISAPSPLRALAILDEQPSISLLFTDVVMPEMDGRRLADRARIKRPDLKVLFTTGYTRDAIVHNGVLDSGTHLLPKPFSIDDLAAKVRSMLDEY
jgi:CheY-like chemotaxis protein